MDGLYTTLVLVAIVSSLYILLKFQLSKNIDDKFQQSYKARIQADVQEFYREMESYAALLENRILQFKKLVERQESNYVKYTDLLEKIKNNKKGKQITEFVERSVAKEQELLEAIQTLKQDSARIIEEVAGKKPVAPKEYSQIKKESKPVVSTTPGKTNSSMEQPVQQLLKEQASLKADKEKNSFIETLGKIGKKITPMLTGESPSSSQQTNIEKSHASEKITRTFDQSLLENMHIYPPLENNTEPATMATTVPGEKTKKASENKRKQQLSKSDLEQALQDLSVTSKRPAALNLLLSQGLTIDNISDYTGLPLSDLAATKSIYNL